MSTKICILILLISVYTIRVHGQKVDSDSLIFQMEAKIKDFFIEQGMLSKERASKCTICYFATELKDQKVLGYNNDGIYVIGTLQAHSKRHILIKEDSKFRIFNLRDVYLLLKEVIDFAEKKQIDIYKLNFYLNKIIRIYEMDYPLNPR